MENAVRASCERTDSLPHYALSPSPLAANQGISAFKLVAKDGEVCLPLASRLVHHPSVCLPDCLQLLSAVFKHDW